MAEIKLDSIAPNASILKQYKDTLHGLIREMRQSIIDDVVRPYRSDLAMDGIADWIGHVMDNLVNKWQDRLGKLSDDVANDLVGKCKTHYDRRLQNMLKKRGFIINFRNSRYVEDQTQIAIGENVSLIKSIANQYLDNVRAAVWRSVKNGYDLESLIKQLRHIDGVSERRATNIAKDQVAKANQMFEDARAQELGITKAIWLHSSAAKVPRADHVKANGIEYEIEKGCYISGEYIKPAQLINCKCRKRLVIEINDNFV